MPFEYCRNVTTEAVQSATFSETERKRIFSGTTGILFLHLDPAENPQDRLTGVLVNRPRIPAVPLQVLTVSQPHEFIQQTDINRFKG